MKTSLMRSEFAFFQSSLRLFQTKYLVKCRRIPLELNRKFRRRSFTHASSRKNKLGHSRPNHAVAAKIWRRRKKTSVLHRKQVRRKRSGRESTRLQAVWPGCESRCRRYMWVEFVVGSLPCSERFYFQVFRFTLLLKTKNQLPSPKLFWKAWTLLGASRVSNQYFVQGCCFIASCKVIRIPESGKILSHSVKSGI